MLHRILLVCVLVSLYSEGSSLSCRWLDHKFRQHSETSLNLLDTMANTNNSTNSTEDATATNSANSTEDAEGKKATVDFPYHLYSHVSKAAAEAKLGFTVHLLDEVSALFEEEDHSNASWEESTVDDFVNVVTQQADGLRSCIVGHKHKHKKLQMYFKRLSDHVLKQMGHSAEAWEFIRGEIKTHLMRADQLLTKN